LSKKDVMMGRVSATLLVCGLLACQPRLEGTADLAITHVTVVDLASGELVPDQTLLIRDDRITSVGPSTDDSPHATATVDATGLFAIPGLWDAHVHSATSVEWHFPLLIAHGVTAVRNMHSTADSAVELTNAIQRRLDSGELLGPRFLANGPVVDGSPPVWPGSAVADTEAEGRAVVDSLVELGADFIKVYDRLSRDAYDGIVARARELGISVDGHVPIDVPPDAAAEAGQRTVEHTSGIIMGCSTKADSLRSAHDDLLEIVSTLSFPENAIAFFNIVRAAADSRDLERCDETVRAYLDNGVSVVPTLVVNVGPQGVIDHPDRLAMLPPAVREQWVAMSEGPADPIGAIMGPLLGMQLENVRMLHEAGVPVLAGTDLGNPFLVPGASLHDELAILVEGAGLTPLEALRSATLHPARVFDMADSLGVLADGMLADIVLLRSNPLDDIRNTTSVEAVVLGGRLFDQQALDGLRAGRSPAHP